MSCPRLVVAIFAALAITVFQNARPTLAQDDPTSGTSVDGTWDGGGPALDEDAASADKVLEIPQTACSKDGATVPCDGAAAGDSDDDGQAINAPSPGAPPQVFDDDTASAGTPDDDWGNADDYQNQQVYAVPYALYPYAVAVPRTMSRRPQVPSSAYAPMSGPLTQATTPPLNQGPWMNPPTMSAFARPAGGPMVMSNPFLALHH